MNRSHWVTVIILLISAAIFAFVLDRFAEAAVYYYQDENGKVHITDTPPHKGYKVIVPSSKEQLSINDDQQRIPTPTRPPVSRAAAPGAAVSGTTSSAGAPVPAIEGYSAQEAIYNAQANAAFAAAAVPAANSGKSKKAAKKGGSVSAGDIKSSISRSNFYEVDDTKYSDIIDQYAKLNSLPFNLVRAIVKAESDFNPKCLSHSGAMGLMQLMPGTAKLVGVSAPYDPAQNVMGGTRYFRQMLDQFKNIELALAAYNAGPTTVLKAGKRIPNIKETQNYVKKVLFYYGMFNQNGRPFAESEQNNRLAIIYYRRGEIKKALLEFKKVIKTAPNYAPAYYNMGYIYSQEGEYTKAIDMYKKAIKIDPYLKAAYYNLAITLERRGLLEMAVATWSAYMSYETDSDKIKQAKKYIEELRDYISSNQ